MTATPKLSASAIGNPSVPETLTSFSKGTLTLFGSGVCFPQFRLEIVSLLSGFAPRPKHVPPHLRSVHPRPLWFSGLGGPACARSNSTISNPSTEIIDCSLPPAQHHPLLPLKGLIASDEFTGVSKLQHLDRLSACSAPSWTPQRSEPATVCC